tara:strand:- start:337 stop:792 length:456 start_codon:yes stop_codon:yes gene_type:complete
MAYKMKEFGGFKSSPKAKSFSKGLDMTLNDNLNKAVRTQNFRDAGNKTKTVSSKTNVGNKVVDAKEFLKKNTIKPKVKKPLSRPFGPGTRPLARNVSRGLKAFGRTLGAVGVVATIAPHIVKGAKAVMPGLKKRAKQEFKSKRSIYSSPKI